MASKETRDTLSGQMTAIENEIASLQKQEQTLNVAQEMELRKKLVDVAVGVIGYVRSDWSDEAIEFSREMSEKYALLFAALVALKTPPRGVRS